MRRLFQKKSTRENQFLFSLVGFLAINFIQFGTIGGFGVVKGRVKFVSQTSNLFSLLFGYAIVNDPKALNSR